MAPSGGNWPPGPGNPRDVGGFRIAGLLGTGGMGRVYLGFSPSGRAVAVKVVHPELARDPEFRERFRREVTAAWAVNGAYTAPVIDADPDDRLPWLATAYVAGPSLAEAVREIGPLPEEALWKLAAGLAEALAAIHRTGMIHRDLKPSNVLLAADGPRVIDFGVSRAMDTLEPADIGEVVGTPGFMSPEQAAQAETSPPSDVFSLGAVLAFAATGHGPFGEGRAISVLYRVAHDEPDLAGMSGPLRDLATLCLAKDPRARPGAAALLSLISAHIEPGRRGAAFWPEPLDSLVRAHADADPAMAPPGPGDGWPAGPEASAPWPELSPAGEDLDATSLDLFPAGGYGGPPDFGDDFGDDFPPGRGDDFDDDLPPGRGDDDPAPRGWPEPEPRPRPRSSRGLLVSGVVGVLVLGGGTAGALALTGSHGPRTTASAGASSSAAATPGLASPQDGGTAPSATPSSTAAATTPATATPTPSAAATPTPTASHPPTATATPTPTAPAATASPTPARTSATPSPSPTATLTRLGPPDWSGYCQSIGEGRAKRQGTGWVCSGDGMQLTSQAAAVCAFTYNLDVDQVTASASASDPSSWTCYRESSAG